MSIGVAEAREFLRRTGIAVPAVVIGLLVMPMVVTQRTFGTDWTLHLWLVRQQQWNIEAMGHPGLFVSAKPLGAFYPIFSFVGTGIYTVGGYLAIVLGDRPIVAYKILFALGLCSGYGGMTWLSVQRGLSGWRSQIPGLVFVTGTWFISDFASRGDFGEFMAVTAIPLVLASLCALVRTPRVRLWNLLAVVAAVFVFTGSHNITLLWGTVFIALLAAVALLAYLPLLLHRPRFARIFTAIGCAAIGAGLNAWYLFPDVRYGLRTSIAQTNRGKLPTVIPRYGFLLGVLRPSYSIRFTIEVTFVVWAVVVAILGFRGRDAATNRLLAGVLVLGGAFVLLTADQGLWRHLPHPFYNVQFSRRLNAYALLATALLVMLALGSRTTTRQRVAVTAAASLVAISAFAVGLGVWQLWRGGSQYHVPGRPDVVVGPSFGGIVVSARTEIPPSWYAPTDFRDVTTRYIPTPEKPTLELPLDRVHGDTFDGVVPVPSGTKPFRTNIAASPTFVTMRGIRAVGRTKRGLVVAVRGSGEPLTGPLRVQIEPADSQVLRAGALVSELSAVALGALLLWPLRRFVPIGQRRSPGTTAA